MSRGHRSTRPGGRVLGLAAGLILLGGCGDHSKNVRAKEPTAPVDLTERLVVEEVELPDIKPVSALLTNRDAGAARARIGGTLIELSVREGDLVKEGQVLAVVADDRRELEASAGASAAAAAEARAIQARAELKRVEDLFSQGVYAQARLDEARAQAHAAEAQLKSARAGSAALAEVASQGKIFAPADGRVIRAPVPQGAVVMPGEMVAEIATGRRVLRAELPEADGTGLREGDEIRIVKAGEAAELSAKILQVYPAVQDGKVVIDIDATGLDGGFVGMRVPALVPIGARPSITIPESYVLVRFGVDYVRLLREDGSVIEAPVQRGRQIVREGEHLLEILAGLRAGDVILPAAPVGDEKTGVLARDAT